MGARTWRGSTTPNWLALVFQRPDPAARRRQIKWMLAPLWVILGLLFLAGLLNAVS
jgi:hypothetical protein